MQDVMEIMGSDLEKIIELSQANLKYLPTASNVQGYGAVGDGGTDDTVSVQAAIDATIAAGGKVVYFPHGTYKVTSLTNTALVVFVGDNAKFSGISDLIYQFGAIPLSFISRQALINGNFDVWQRGTSFTNPASGVYTADRWKQEYTLDGGTLPSTIVHSQQTLTSGTIDNSFNFYRININGAGSAFGANAVYVVRQKIEFGTRYLAGNGKKVTVSFWARSDISGKKLGLYLVQRYGTGGTPSASEVCNGTNWTLTSTWTKYSFTFTTNTLSGKTFGSNNDDVLDVVFSCLWGANNAGPVGAGTTPETFGGAGNIDIAQVQINGKDQALPFQPKTYSQEYIDSLRYRWQSWADGQNSPVVGTIGAVAFGGNLLIANVRYPVPMRVSPTLQVTNNNVLNQVRNSETGSQIAATFTSVSGSNKGFALLSFSGSPFTVGNHYDFDIIADAEI